jgi:neutral ceramidase
VLFSLANALYNLLLLSLQELWSAPGTAVTGSLDYRHAYIDISNMQLADSRFAAAGATCPGAMGYSFAAGTTDGE